MKLLFDQNLAPRLVRSLADIYPDSLHVRDTGMAEATDKEVWEYAKQNDLIIVSKDNDFQQLSILFGSPPKVIWLRVGNCTVKQAEELLRKHSITIHNFVLAAGKTFLVLP
jgi:predicted nuclease of predicted toxin-antitoxin system